MNTGQKRSALSYIPGLTNNSVLKVILFSGTAYVVFGLIWSIISLLYGNATNYHLYFIPAVALADVKSFPSHWWTIFTYGWFHYIGFFEFLSNMLWLYMFGSVVQVLVGHRQVIPIYAYSMLVGGVFYLLAQFLPGAFGHCPPNILGPRAGLMGLAIATITISPTYRFYITETFTVPLAAVVGIFAFLSIINSQFYFTLLMMLVGGGLCGFGYILLLNRGYKPGAWMYSFTRNIESLVTPADEMGSGRNYSRPGGSGRTRFQPRNNHLTNVDDILDKINQKGYKSLSAEEKAILKEAGK